MSKLTIFVLFLQLLSLLLIGVIAKTPLYIAGLQELSNVAPWYRFAYANPFIINITLDKINQQEGLLDEYQLNMIYRDNEVGSVLTCCR